MTPYIPVTSQSCFMAILSLSDIVGLSWPDKNAAQNICKSNCAYQFRLASQHSQVASTAKKRT